MNSLNQLLVLTTIFILDAQVYGGYWMCDWVDNRGWMYCSRGQCTVIEKKRDIKMTHEPKGPTQNNDGIYCFSKEVCFKCTPIDSYTCNMDLQKYYVSSVETSLNSKRAVNDYCE